MALSSNILILPPSKLVIGVKVVDVELVGYLAVDEYWKECFGNKRIIRDAGVYCIISKHDFYSYFDGEVWLTPYESLQRLLYKDDVDKINQCTHTFQGNVPTRSKGA
jgi:hypothetical protein